MRKYIGNRVINFIKNVHVSVRLDDRIYKYIMSVDGKNFSDKLENLVIEHAEISGKCIT